jgi:hypothetical protein
MGSLSSKSDHQGKIAIALRHPDCRDEGVIAEGRIPYQSGATGTVS